MRSSGSYRNSKLRLLCVVLFCPAILVAASSPSWPNVDIVTPTNLTIWSGGDLPIAVSAADVDGSVGNIYFFVGTNLLTIDSAPPFTAIWTNPLPGRYVLSARANDNSGRSTESSKIFVQVGAIYVDQIIRGPYLQSATPSNIVVRWTTDWPTASRIRYGTNASELTGEVKDSVRETDHAVLLPQLAPNTRYFYSISSDLNVLTFGTNYFFTTPPPVGTPKPTRIWAIGDSGTADVRARAVRDSYLAFNDRPTDLWLMLGDNAYESGSDVEYQRAVFDVYPELLRNIVLWPTIGNHDFGLGERMPYLDIFTLPAHGEAGGIASGTERYYSFDYANIHFICLDSSSSSRLPGSAMFRWLENDLVAITNDWIIAYWHHPPYSKGSHDSDTEIDLIEMRQYALPILEDYGVDLVLCGHSHVYERSYLLDGHYGPTNSFSTSMIVDSGYGRSPRPYTKPTGAFGERQGAVYIVCGCSGEGGANTVQIHPAMRVSMGGYGSMIIDIDRLRLDAQFLHSYGEVDDYFTILKAPPGENARPRLRIRQAEAQAQLSWPISAVPFTLETSSLISGAAEWSPVPITPAVKGLRNIIEIENSDSPEFFRLRKASP